LKRKEDNSCQKPIEKRTKTKLSLQVKRILQSDEDDYEKAKLYQQTLSRFLKLKKKLAEETVAETAEEPKAEAKSKSIKQPRRQPSPEPIRKSACGKKQKVKWEEY
jgi:hypothetical protein